MKIEKNSVGGDVIIMGEWRIAESIGGSINIWHTIHGGSVTGEFVVIDGKCRRCSVGVSDTIQMWAVMVALERGRSLGPKQEHIDRENIKRPSGGKARRA